MPRRDAARPGIVDKTLKPAWICFLTTDKHTLLGFEEWLQKQKEEGRKRMKEIMADPGFWPAFVLSLPSIPIVLFQYAYIEARYRSIDIELMHLQRREVLWAQLLMCTNLDDAARQQERKTLRMALNAAWSELWFGRPTD